MADNVTNLSLRRPIELSNGFEVYPVPGDSVRNRSEHDIITIDGFQHELYTSEPAITTENPPYIMVYPGYLEHAGYGIGRKFHETIARFMPDAHVIGVATDGFGTGAEQRYGWDERHEHDLAAMGRRRSDIIEEIVPPEAPILFVVTSMGSIILKEVARNLPEKRLTHVAGGVLNACAVVEKGAEDDKHSHRRAFGKFLFSIVPDIGKELVQTPPSRMVSEIRTLVDSGHLSRDDYLPLGLLLADIASGSQTADIDLMLNRFRNGQFGLLIGADDPVAESKKWIKRAEDYDNLTVKSLKGRSHGIVLNPVRNGRAAVKLLHESQAVSPLEIAV